MKAVVIGAGGMGSAAARFLAKDGHQVTLLERFTLDHDQGSSFGESRITRRTYPDVLYTQMMMKAYPLWDELCAESGEDLFVRCGGVFFGKDGHATLFQVEEALKKVGVPFQRFWADEANQRFPGLHLLPGEVAIFQKDSGFLRASSCVKANARLAVKAGAQLKENVIVKGLKQDGSGVRVETNQGDFAADKVVLTPGSWLGDLLPALKLPLKVTRQQYVYLKLKSPADAKHYQAGAFPVWIYATPTPEYEVYGFPIDGRVDGVKLAEHTEGDPTHPDKVDRNMKPETVKTLQTFAAQRLPFLSDEVTYSKTCLYTNTPDHHFVIDEIPGLAGNVFMGGCSGHAFKFTILLGRIAADWVQGKPMQFDLSRFKYSRFK